MNTPENHSEIARLQDTRHMEQMGTCHQTLRGLLGEQEATRMMAETREPV